jgi:hypothetical protein
MIKDAPEDPQGPSLKTAILSKIRTAEPTAKCKAKPQRSQKNSHMD